MTPNTGENESRATDEVFVAPDPIPSFPMRAPYDAEAEAAARSRIDDIFAEIEEELRLEAERAEQARIEAELRELERIEAERLAREEAERQEAERIAREEAERQEAERLEAERKAREEAERLEAEAALREELARQLAAATAASHMAPIDEEAFARLEERPRRGAHFAAPLAEAKDEAVVRPAPFGTGRLDVPTESDASLGAADGAVAPTSAERAPLAADLPGPGILEELEYDVPEDADSEQSLESMPQFADGPTSVGEAACQVGSDMAEGDEATWLEDTSVTSEADAASADESVEPDHIVESSDIGLGLSNDDFDDLDEKDVDASECDLEGMRGIAFDEARVEEATDDDVRSLDLDSEHGAASPVLEDADDAFGDFDDIGEPEVVVIYDEAQIEEAVDVPATQEDEDPDLDATLVLDRVADAVKKLRVEGESAPAVQVREQSPDTVIHTEYQVSEDDKERLEVVRRDVASAKQRHGSGFFARIGAFVVKALRLDER